MLLGTLVGAAAVWLALRERVRAAEGAAAAERRLADERLAIATRSESELRRQFPALAAQALRENKP